MAFKLPRNKQGEIEMWTMGPKARAVYDQLKAGGSGRGMFLPVGTRPDPAALKREIDDELKSELAEPGEVKRRIDRTLAKSDGIEARRQALAAEGLSPNLAEAYIGAELNQRAAEYLDRFPVQLEWQPQTARRLALADMRAGR